MIDGFDMAGFGQVFGRLVFLFAVALIIVRVMGNRTVGQLSPFDFVIMVGIGDIIITGAMDTTQTLAAGIAGLVSLLVLQQVLSYLSLKSLRMRKWFEGTPVTLIQDGKLLKENFSRHYFNYDDLRQELHRQGMDIVDVKNIKVGRLESCGVFSVIKYPDSQPITRKDLDEYMIAALDRPLSPLGQKWSRIETALTDLQEMAALWRQSTAAAKLGETPKPAGQQTEHTTH